MKKTLIISILLLLLSPLLTRAEDAIPSIPEPHIGCPDYIPCDQETGKIFKDWTELLKPAKNLVDNTTSVQTFFNKSGIPVYLWYRGNIDQLHKNALIWDSPCKNHQQIEKPIAMIQSFIKQLPSPVGTSEIISGIALLQAGTKFTVYPTPARSAALFINGDRPHYQLEEQGNYVHFEIDSQGKIVITEPIKPLKFAQEIPCPPDLSQEFLKLHTHESIYSTHYCKEIWNSKTNSYQKILYGWSCN